MRLLKLLRLEDLLMALLAVIVLPLIDGWLGESGSGTPAATDPTALEGLVGLLAVAGVMACLVTRGPDEPPPLADRQMTLQGWARFPLAAGVGIVATETLPGLGLDPEPLVAVTFLVMIAGALLHPRLPVAPVLVRRTLVLPMAIVAAGAFDQIIGRGLPDLVVALLGGTAQPGVVALAPLVIAAILVLYAMLVIAPRSIADPGASGVAWLVRFLFLLASVVMATLVGGVG
ncbi:MAG: hypothetical protein ACYC65_04985 [Candidatus Limnocylindrales bacterium]